MLMTLKATVIKANWFTVWESVLERASRLMGGKIVFSLSVNYYHYQVMHLGDRVLNTLLVKTRIMLYNCEKVCLDRNFFLTLHQKKAQGNYGCKTKV
jgi:hypothetical protein